VSFRSQIIYNKCSSYIETLTEEDPERALRLLEDDKYLAQQLPDLLQSVISYNSRIRTAIMIIKETSQIINLDNQFTMRSLLTEIMPDVVFAEGVLFKTMLKYIR
jgi:hypothetical protein